MRLIVTFLVWIFLTPYAAFATTITGTAINLSTSMPASGDLVIIQSKDGDELGRTTTDRAGAFSFETTEREVFVRVVHQNFQYVSAIETETGAVRLGVYDVVRNLNEITVIDAQRYEADKSSLNVMEVLLVRNDSSPPRTLRNHGFEVFLPNDAMLEAVSTQRGKQTPIRLHAMSGKLKGQYFLNQPLLPGETRFDIYYRLPYTGERRIETRFSVPVRYYMIAVPKGMQMQAEQQELFSTTRDEPQANMYYTGQIGSGTVVGFKLSGFGTIPGAKRPQMAEKKFQVPELSSSPRSSAPTIAALEPKVERSPNRTAVTFLIMMCAITLVGVIVFVRRQHSRKIASSRPSNGRAELVVQALTEELSRLENLFANRQMSASEYAEKKRALRLTIARANSRMNPASSNQRSRTERT